MKNTKTYIALICWLSSIVAISWIPEQGDFNTILSCLIVAFAGYWYVYKYQVDIKPIIVMALIARLLVVPTFPNLSDDIFRFIWDGRLTQAGINPFVHLPTEIVGSIPLLDSGLLGELNSPDYYSIYPTVPQVIFWITNLFPSSSYMTEALIMKSIHLGFELGSLRLIWLLLQQYQLPKKYWTLYALNPLIIIEVLANVHHEGIMMFFLLACLYTLNGKKFIVSGGLMALAICTKILPLLLCPLIFFYLSGRARWKFTLSCIGLTGLLFAPILLSPDLISNLSDSAGLYMSTFEFNGGLYYLLRSWGYVIYGYNIIGSLGPALKVISALSILCIAFFHGPKLKKEQLPLFMIITYGIYTILSITIHPWYIVMLIGLSVFTQYRFAIIWSALIMLTYINYSYSAYHENLWVVFLEYSLVFAFLFKEVRTYHPFIKIEGSKA